MNWVFKILLWAVLAFVAKHFIKLFYITESYGNTVAKRYPGECKLVKGLSTKGAEDMTLLPSGHIIITSDLYVIREVDLEKDVAKGSVYVMDTNKGYDSVEELAVKGWPEGKHFIPHGIHHWVHENNSVSVFIVLHEPESIGRFLYDGKKTLTLTKIFKNNEYMRNINSLFVTSEDSFYVTNIFHSGLHDILGCKLEYALMLPLANVIYVKGDNYKWAAQHLFIANGLAGNDEYLYVAVKDKIMVYSRYNNGSLSLSKTIPIAIGSMDNVWLDAAGDLWIGCQPFIREVVRYMGDYNNKKCHSTILRVRDPLADAEVESVFVDDTSLIQGSSTAIYLNNKLIIGSFVDKMVTCDVKYLSSGKA